ncbi:hypothetical protein [Nonomuraea sp. NPDC050310]|uniref:hypothetical protein n=1 Tax=Nonomuraea sp. NPDC050310 TaxID=3154935 RepID=UPI0033FC3C00
MKRVLARSWRVFAAPPSSRGAEDLRLGILFTMVAGPPSGLMWGRLSAFLGCVQVAVVLYALLWVVRERDTARQELRALRASTKHEGE